MNNRKVYLDNACTSLVHPSVLQAAEDYADLHRSSTKSATDISNECLTYYARARQSVSRLIHCSEDEIALVESTSHGLGIVADALTLSREDNVLVADLEYLASALCWKRKQQITGFELRKVTTKDGALTCEDFARCTDDHTRVILLAAVQEVNGFRADLKEIADFAHERGILIIVDGIQEAGAMAVDVKKTGVDFYCAGGKKWIGNPFGMGFLYIRKELIRTLQPDFFAAMNILPPVPFPDFVSYLEYPGRSPFDHFEIRETAAKFENGGYGNYIGALGLSRAADLLLEKDPVWIEKKIKSLVIRYMDGLEALGITPRSSRDPVHMSSIVVFNFGFRNNDISRERRLVNFLLERNIYVSLRCSTGTGGIRASMHYYNTEEDVDALLQGISDFLKSEA
ncbi:MAG: aminotransferase class V-fold PLP-dependent enzyme [Emergencia sp.]